MLRKLLLLAAPLLIVLALEALFRAGLWEPLARPDSHAGTSVRLKRMLTSADLTRVDYVTLGSSRPLYGLDHARIAASAHGRGFVHANLSMPGTHWMTIGALGRWLASHRPEVRGGIVALSIQDFSWPGNGSYELGIVQPFRAFFAVSDAMPYVPFDGSRIDTYGSRSALFEWREDVRDFARNPGKRLGALRWYQRNRSSVQQLFANPESEGDMCAIGVTALSACDRTNDMDDGKSRQLAGQCEVLRREATNRFDFRPAMASASPPGTDGTHPIRRRARPAHAGVAGNARRRAHAGPGPLEARCPGKGTTRMGARGVAAPCRRGADSRHRRHGLLLCRFRRRMQRILRLLPSERIRSRALHGLASATVGNFATMKAARSGATP